MDANLTMGLEFPDLKEMYAIEVRRGVVEVKSSILEKTDVRLVISKPVFLR